MKHCITRFLGGLIAFFGVPNFYGVPAITDAYGAPPAVGTQFEGSGSAYGLCKLFGNSEYAQYRKAGTQSYYVGWPNMYYKGTQEIWIDSPDWRKNGNNGVCTDIAGYDSGLCWYYTDGRSLSDAKFKAAVILPTSSLTYQSGVHADVAFWHKANGTVRDRVLYSPSAKTFINYGCCLASGVAPGFTGSGYDANYTNCPCFYGSTDGTSGVYIVSGTDGVFYTPILSVPYYDFYFINCAPGYYQESENSVATTSSVPTRVIAGPGGAGAVSWDDPCRLLGSYNGSPWCLTSGCVTTGHKTLSYIPGRCMACPNSPYDDTNLSSSVSGYESLTVQWPYKTATTEPFESGGGVVTVLSSTVGITSCDIEFQASNTSGVYIYSCDKYTK